MRYTLITNLGRVLISNHDHDYVKHVSLFRIFLKKIHFSSVSYKSRPVWGTNKQHRKIKLFFQQTAMADPRTEEILAPLRLNVKSQVTRSQTIQLLLMQYSKHYNADEIFEIL